MRRQVVDRSHLMVAPHLTPQLLQPADHYAGDGGRSATRKRPPAGVGRGEHEQRDGAGAGLAQAEEAVRRGARQEGARFAFPEGHAGQELRRQKAGQPEPGQQHRVAGRPGRPQDHVEKRRRMADERLQQGPVGGLVTTQARRGLGHRTLDDDGGAVIEGVRQWRRRSDQVQAQRTEKRHQRRQGHDRRADVVAESRLQQLLGPQTPARPRRPLQHEDRSARLGQGDGGRQTVGPGADDHGIVPLPHPLSVTAREQVAPRPLGALSTISVRCRGPTPVRSR